MRIPGGPRGRGPAPRRFGRREWLILSALAGATLASAAAAPRQDPLQTAAPVRPPAAPPASLDPFDSAPALQAERLRGLRPEIVRAILRDDPGGEIALAVLACPVPAAAGNARIALFIEIDGGTFLDANQASVAPVEIYAYALTAAGAVAGYLAEAFTLDVARHGEAVWNGGLRFVAWLELPPGSYQMRVMVHNARSLARGLAFTRLEVPMASADRPRLPPPLIAGPRFRDPWLAVRGRAGWLPAEGNAYPFAAAGRPLLPAARPVLVGGHATDVVLFADRLPPGPVTGLAELLAAGSNGEAAGSAAGDRRVVATAQIETTGQQRAAGDVASLTVRFLSPAVPPGAYDLRLRIDSPDGPLLTPTIAIVAIDAGPQDRELLWSDLKGLERQAGAAVEAVAEAERGTEPAGARRPRGGRGSRRAAARYRRALAAATAAGAARPAAIFDFEMATLGGGGDRPLARLRAAELQAAAQLGRTDAALLLPVISIHDELFHLYRRRHLFSLVTHTRRLLEALAELYAELGGEPQTTAGILASVGGYMQQLRAPGDSRRLFGRALEHHPDNPAALLGLASSYEKYGEYAEAVDRLERLVAAWPELEEARLRLALNLERTGDRQRFRELLSPIATGDGTDWVSAVACQELARSQLEAGLPEEAAPLLRGALQRMPERQALWILLAHVHDRQGLLSRSWESLESVAAAPAAAEPSERLTYDDWANGPLERARLALSRDSAGLRAALVEELGRGAAVKP